LTGTTSAGLKASQVESGHVGPHEVLGELGSFGRIEGAVRIDTLLVGPEPGFADLLSLRVAGAGTAPPVVRCDDGPMVGYVRGNGHVHLSRCAPCPAGDASASTIGQVKL
jgi:hypothetical protein